MTTPFTGLPDSAVYDFRASKAGVSFDAGPDDDLIFGSNHADTLGGGPGCDVLFGFGGDDTLQGGADLGAAAGGTGFLLRPGDLIASAGLGNGYGGLVDTVLDFGGAGTSGSGEEDVIRLEGFSADVSVRFAGYGPTRSLQFYEFLSCEGRKKTCTIN